VLRDTVESTLSNILGIIDLGKSLADIESKIRAHADDQHYPEETLTAQKEAYAKCKQEFEFAPRYLNVAAKAMAESMRFNLEVEDLLDPDVVKPASRVVAGVKALRDLQLTALKLSFPAVKRCYQDLRQPRLKLIKQYVLELEDIAGPGKARRSQEAD